MRLDTRRGRMIVSNASRSTIATRRTPTTATRMCIALGSNLEIERKIHHRGLECGSVAGLVPPRTPTKQAIQHNALAMNPERQVRMKLVKVVPTLFVVGMLLTACGGSG